MKRWARGRGLLPYAMGVIVCALCPAMADDSVKAQPLPSFAELQAAGAVIGEIRVEPENIFDLKDPKEDNILFRAANLIHIKTRPSVIKRSLLFHSGEPVSVRLIEETERLLLGNAPIYEVRIEPFAYHDGIVDIEVTTRDTWTLQPGLSYSRSGGVNSGGVSVSEQNLAGTGIAIGVGYTSTVDRSGSEFHIADTHVLGGWTTISYDYADYTDGFSEAFRFDRPFYALDTRWAAGASGSTFDRVDSLYTGGNVIGQYHHHQDSGEVYGGWSPGLIEGWTQRYSAGVSYQADTYQFDPTLSPPAQPPANQTLAGPFVSYEVVEDKYQRLQNRDRIQRPEYFNMGFQGQAKVERALPAFGSTQSSWLLSASATEGLRMFDRHDLLTSASYSGQYGTVYGDVQALGASARYYAPHSPVALFYVAVSGDVVKSPNPADQLLLGGDNGLRGYPLRYQAGARRALFTVEERVYTDWYPFRLFRVGGAVYYDVGRAWGGPIENPNPGWLSDVGFGLRILSDRAAFGNILHVDLAFPLHNTDPSIRSSQFLVTTHKTF